MCRRCGVVILKATHNDIMCRHKDRQNGAKRITDERGNGSRGAAADYVFRMEDADIKLQLLVDMGPPHTSLIT